LQRLGAGGRNSLSVVTFTAVDLFHTTGPKFSKLASKYPPLVPVLRKLILRQDTRSAKR
jgi:hypothetical protein